MGNSGPIKMRWCQLGVPRQTPKMAIYTRPVRNCGRQPKIWTTTVLLSSPMARRCSTAIRTIRARPTLTVPAARRRQTHGSETTNGGIDLGLCPTMPLLATAPVGSVADPKVFRSGRNFSARIGLVFKPHACVKSR